MYEPNQDQAILEYLPLVERVVRQLKVKSRDYEEGDLINIGVIGLMDALERFDSSKKVPFESYAYTRIKGTIIDEVRKTSKVPRSRMTRLNAFYQAKEELTEQLGRTPTDQELCQAMGITEKQLKVVHETVHSLASVSLDEVLFQDSESDVSLMEMLEDEETPHVEES